MQELINTDGEGSKTKLNSVLSAYGVNYDLLRDFYETEMKLQAVKTHLYGENASLIGDTVKTEYLEEHYVRCRQIFLATYAFVAETDANEDVIYYQTEEGKTNRIFYDDGNGEAHQLEDGSLEKDKNGDVIYYVKNTNYKVIAYNTKGEPHYLKNKEGTGYQTREMTEEEMDAVVKRAEALFGEVKDSTDAAFEAKVESESDGQTDVSEYNEGYYLRADLDYTASGAEYAYLDKIVTQLKEMNVGDVRIVQSGSGFHIIRKYDHAEKAYSKAENEVWFKDFNSKLIEELFLEECGKHYGDVKIDEAILADAPTMKEVGINYFF